MGKDLRGRDLGKCISQRQDGRYQARFTNRFGKRESYCDYQLHLVREWLDTNMAKDKLAMNVIESSTTLDEWFVKWMEEYKYGIIRANTERHYKQVYMKHISPVLGNRRLSEVTQLQVKGLINDLDKAGYKYETKSKVRILLVDMYTKAMVDDFAKKNPARGIKIVRDDEKEPRYLTEEEQKIFFDYCKGTFYDNLFTVAINSGLRPGELYALEESDLDFERKVIKVTKTLVYQKLEGDTQKTFHIGPPKTKSSIREVPMTRACEAALMRQIFQSKVVKKKSPKELDEKFKNLLFTTKFGTPINAQIECDAIKSILDGINLMRDDLEQIEAFSGHCFRHTFASNCYKAGFKLKRIQKLLGHATLKMTEDLYVHLFQTDEADDMEKLSEAMEKIEQADDSEEAEQRFRALIAEREEKAAKVIKFA